MKNMKHDNIRYFNHRLFSEWSQVIALIIALVGVTAWLDGKHREDMRYHREDMLKVTQNIERMETHHREDVQELRNGLKEMDAKWERLFERLLIQDQQKKSN